VGGCNDKIRRSDFLELNESELIERELTIRDLRISKEVLDTRRSAMRWLALSLGIVNPGESRLSAVAVLDALVNFQFVKRQDPSVKELVDYINANWEKINEKTLRYHLLRMKRMGFVENEKGRFSFRQTGYGDRFDAEEWSRGAFESFYSGVAAKVGEVVNGLKNKEQLV
jgi:hypothetical protein